MLYRKQTTAMPTKNSAEEAESPTMCVAVTERLQRVAFPSTSGTWLNLAAIQDGEVLFDRPFSKLIDATDGLSKPPPENVW